MERELQTLEYYSIPIRLPESARQMARKFANEQSSQRKAQQVYDNSLAVYAVNNYLRIIDVPTDLAVSDSWNGAVRLAADVADLWIRGVGRLECRPIQADELTCYIPPEARFDRFGCVVVQISSDRFKATLLGFFAADSDDSLPERIKLEDLQPTDALIDCITEREKMRVVALLQWLEENFEPDWQPVELLTRIAFKTAGSPKLGLDPLKRPVKRGKIIFLGREAGDQKVALVMQLIPKTGEEFNLFLCLYPARDSAYLPSDLQVTVLDEKGTPCMEEESRNDDIAMHLEFGAMLGERFSVRLALGKVCITEHFML